MGSPWPAAVLRASPRSRAEASPPPLAVWRSERPGMVSTPAPRAWLPPGVTTRVPRLRSREADWLRTWLGREVGWRPPGRRWACRAKRWEGRSRWGADRTLTFPVTAERERRRPEPDRPQPWRASTVPPQETAHGRAASAAGRVPPTARQRRKIRGPPLPPTKRRPRAPCRRRAALAHAG